MITNADPEHGAGRIVRESPHVSQDYDLAQPWGVLRPMSPLLLHLRNDLAEAFSPQW